MGPTEPLSPSKPFTPWAEMDMTVEHGVAVLIRYFISDETHHTVDALFAFSTRESHASSISLRSRASFVANLKANAHPAQNSTVQFKSDTSINRIIARDK